MHLHCDTIILWHKMLKSRPVVLDTLLTQWRLRAANKLVALLIAPVRV